MSLENAKPRAEPILLSSGFRVFFLFAGLAAVANGLAWLAWLGIHAFGGAVTKISISMAPHLWHGHEMIFGYAMAVVAGFFLTAVPSWTGTAPLHGRPLLLLAGTWAIGRIVIWLSAILPAWVVALADLAFIPLLAVFVGQALRAKPAPRNLIVLGVLAFLLIGNVLLHLDGLGVVNDLASTGLAAGVLALTTLIGMIGGRVVPAFTRNALVARNPNAPLPISLKPLEAASILSLWLLLLARLFEAPEIALAVIAGFAAFANALRLALWRGQNTLHAPILWSLHLAYAWVPLGLATLCLAYASGIVAESAAMHGLAIGAVGGMTLAVMSRAALGHSGRALQVAKPIAWAYALVGLAALLRVLGPILLPGLYMTWILGAGVAWTLAFLLYLVVYWPVLTQPSAQAQG